MFLRECLHSPKRGFSERKENTQAYVEGRSQITIWVTIFTIYNAGITFICSVEECQ